MANTALSTLLPLINLPKCPDGLVSQALREASRRFLSESEVWREDIAFTTVTGQTGYTLTLGYDFAYIKRIISVRTGDELKGWTFSRPATLTFSEAPTGSISATARVVYVPNTIHTEVPDWIVAVWGEAIAHGARFLLKSDQGSKSDPSPWYDTEGAVIEKGKFDAAVQTARQEILSEIPPASTVAYLQACISSNLVLCPEQLIYQSFLNASREFIEKSEIWQEEVSFATESGTSDYVLSLSEDAIVSRIVTVRTGDEVFYEDEWTFDRDTHTLSFVTAPTSVETVYVLVVYVPSATAFNLSTWIVAKWGPYISAGAIAAQKANKGSEANVNPWFDAEGAQSARQQFNDGIDAARRDAKAKRQFTDPQLFMRDYCLANLPGCPEPRVYQALRESTRQFFEQSEVWRETISVIKVTDQTAYSLTLPYSYSRIWRIRSIYTSSKVYGESEWSFDDDSIITFEVAPTENLSVEVVLVPSRSKMLAKHSEKWGMQIANGAVAELKATQGNSADPNPWYDLEGAKLAQTKFNAGVDAARLEVLNEQPSSSSLPYIRDFCSVNLPRCPQALIYQSLLEAYRRFLEITEIWREDITTSTSSGVAEYSLTVPDNAVISRILCVTLDDEILGESEWSFDGTDTITLESAPTASGTMFVRVVYLPPVVHAEMDSVIVSKWGTVIAQGAVSIQKANKGSESSPNAWYDTEGAKVAQDRFFSGIQNAKRDIFSTQAKSTPAQHMRDYCSLLLPRCPESLIYQSLLEATRTFLEQSEAWHEDIELATVVSQTDYTLTWSGDAFISRIVSVVVDDEVLEESEWEFDKTNILTLDTAPTSIGTLEVHVVLLPNAVATNIADWITTKWGAVIAQGAVANQKANKGPDADPNAWYDVEGAKLAQAKFNAGIQQAKVEAFSRRQFNSPTREIRDYCVANLPRCPEALIYQSVREATRRFVDETEIWREDIETTTEDGTTEYTLAVPYAHAFIRRVTKVTIDEKEISEYKWSVDNEGVLTLDDDPGGEYDMVVSVVYATKRSRVPSWIFEKWGSVIAHKAVFMQKGNMGSATVPNAWYDPNGAVLERQKYNEGIAEARAEVFHQLQSGEVGITMREF